MGRERLLMVDRSLHCPQYTFKVAPDASCFVDRVNPNLGWAEAFYREPYCRAYFSDREVNPYHWMLHESVHQLNREVARLKLAAMGVGIDTLTPEQEKYLVSWEEGT